MFKVCIMLACGKCETVFQGTYEQAYNEWFDAVTHMTCPIDTVALTTMWFNHEDLFNGKNLVNNPNVLEIA